MFPVLKINCGIFSVYFIPAVRIFLDRQMSDIKGIYAVTFLAVSVEVCYVLLPIATTLVFFFILSLKRDAKVTLKLPLHWVYQVVGLLWKPNKPTCIIFFNILIFTTTTH